MYFDPFIYKKRKGTTQDPFLHITESLVVYAGVIQLTELPHQAQRVTITGYSEKSSSFNIASNQFYVDYTSGIVRFNTSENGKTVTISYYGVGVYQIPANRIWLQNPVGGSQVLEEVLEYLLSMVGTGGGGGTDMEFVAKESFTGLSDTTHVFNQNMYGFSIINDGDTTLTFTINGMLFYVESGEGFEERFDPFTTVVIDTDSPFRAYGIGKLNGT